VLNVSVPPSVVFSTFVLLTGMVFPVPADKSVPFVLMSIITEVVALTTHWNVVLAVWPLVIVGRGIVPGNCMSMTVLTVSCTVAVFSTADSGDRPVRLTTATRSIAGRTISPFIK
jgi:hypothetical protein